MYYINIENFFYTLNSDIFYAWKLIIVTFNLGISNTIILIQKNIK